MNRLVRPPIKIDIGSCALFPYGFAIGSSGYICYKMQVVGTELIWENQTWKRLYRIRFDDDQESNVSETLALTVLKETGNEQDENKDSK